VTIVAAATGDVGVTRVEFRVSGQYLDEDRSPPHQVAWDPAGLVPTTYRLTAIAYDAAGNWRERRRSR
jgi:hypothetical protein